MKALVFGQTGQVAQALVRRAPQGVTVAALSRADADLSDPDACAVVIRATDADVVINAAAFTAVDRAEAEAALAMVVNGDAPAAMARAAAARDLPFLHISSDYVFDGSGTAPHRPEDPVAPISSYGRTKLAGEAGVRAAGGRHLILRTSWVFSSDGSNFVKTMLRLGRERDHLRVVSDQVGGPTHADDIADALFVAADAMRQGQAGGTHHFAGTEDTSWAGFARAVMAEAHLGCAVEDIPSSAYPTPAQRPLNSRLDCTAFAWAFGIARPDWHDGLLRVVRDFAI